MFASDIETCKHVSASLGSYVIPATEPESLSKLLREARVSLCAAVVAHGLVERSGCRQNPHMTFCTRDGSVDEVPLQHNAVARI